MEERVNDLLPLAAKIAREFSNIPGLPHAEIEIVAQEALARAALALDPAKGDFTAYAAAAMRNALRDLHERQSRHHRHHLYDLDLPATTADTQAPPRIERVPALETTPLPDRVAFRESAERLEQAMASLSPRMRRVAEGVRDGKSYSEIGASLGISKQAVQKIAHAAIASLRENLAAMGFHGLDTLGLLKSARAFPHQVDDFPPQP
jgi:RNA polymerase sigma factor (sigma-70 family)